MHLLAAQAGALQQEGEAIDLAQTPGDFAFASSADSELSMLAAAADRVGEDGLRLANLMRLSHNFSVDLWCEDTLAHARLIVIRLIGGSAYWPYGCDEIEMLARQNSIPLAFLPGDATPDPVLLARSTIAEHDWHTLHKLFLTGGPDNADAILSAFRALAAGNPIARAPNPFPAFGFWDRERGIVQTFGPVAPIPSHAESVLDFGAPATPVTPSPLGGEGRGEGGATSTAPAAPLPSGERACPRPDRGSTIAQQGAGERGFAPSATVPILFYRAVLEGAGTATLEALIDGLKSRGLAPVPIVISSLKSPDCAGFVRQTLGDIQPAAIFNLTGFALGINDLASDKNPFAFTDAPVIQLVQGSRPPVMWEADPRGLTSKDLAMQVVLPEIDGRVGALIVGHKAEAVWHERTQCLLTAFTPEPDGIARAVALAQNYARLRAKSPAQRKIALVLANYPLKDGRLANGVGYDAPQSSVEILQVLSEAGYDIGSSNPAPEHAADPSPQPSPPAGEREAQVARPEPHLPSPLERGEGGPEGRMRGGQRLPSSPTLSSGTALIEHLQTGPTNARPQHGTSDAILPVQTYKSWLETLHPCIREDVPARWGAPEADPFVRGDAFHLPIKIFGNIAILLQPARAYDVAEELSFHDPNLVPPHAYIASYLWLKNTFGIDALIHNGKHGNLEWLPGKANALDSESYPSVLWGQLPHFYPFIVNDPGEGTQAKRRTGATIIDHLVPPLTRAETYGPLKDLEALLDEYYAALGMDQRRLESLKRKILDFTRDARLDLDLRLPADETEALNQIDNFLCELKEAQIRDGLHIFGQSPKGNFERDLLVAFARVPRGEGQGGDASLIRALADDLKLGIDPLALDLAAPWTGPKPQALMDQGMWRSNGDTIERLEALAADLVTGRAPDPAWISTIAVLDTIQTTIRPRLAASGPNEIRSLLDGLAGKFVAPGPSGAPTRGRIDTLPTGRNFYSVDNRAIPTQTAWALGQKAAENLLKRHYQDHGLWLTSLAMSVWGTANMRTGGDDIAQALALIGAKPVWQGASLTVSGYEIIPLAKLGRPRVDVTLRISGLFRDAFPAQIALFDRAIRAIGALDEPIEDNPIAARMRTDALAMMEEGATQDEAGLRAGHRIFGAAPGGYGTGIGKLVETGKWAEKSDLADAVLATGQYAYGAHAEGLPEKTLFAARLKSADAVVHVQDNAEHDLLDSDQYYQFEGGLSAAVETLSGHKPAAYHLDTSRPETPKVRTLEEEIARVMRARVVNPKWIDAMKRHSYRGAFEIIATVDFMFGFAATTGAVKSHHFDMAFAAFIEDDATRDFLIAANRFGYDELIEKFNEARLRGFWTPRSNSAYAHLEDAT
ncbi:cobaltochelatase subunit CobN [Pelagibacterium halotolerans]|uniref:Cobaltochelatase subunit CobN n=1 Tax=Pelagibacterium halotolerans (strain DSM 22347 / JCM 15775 / CGMCC 1.7692 / B2) TaxID=1082931 RepID=G4REI5_PELHB|nr:cobaltochelatase subunit CobN [Pelagibacterium halotolerans]AEQ53917.1 CobN component of cobalt chelatase involved in B12 biosynthesis [Pelagibacterium halotolerans B2]QJR19941.1 cobaltochelatase subunit CobN [Pelagibacterium halotolerans]SEA46496.1 cobaltochelatase CobN [Pelagibacterium halotolerans]